MCNLYSQSRSSDADLFCCHSKLLSCQDAKMCVHLTIRAGIVRVLILASIGDQVACEVVESYPAIHSFFYAGNYLCP